MQTFSEMTHIQNMVTITDQLMNKMTL